MSRLRGCALGLRVEGYGGSFNGGNSFAADRVLGVQCDERRKDGTMRLLMWLVMSIALAGCAVIDPPKITSEMIDAAEIGSMPTQEKAEAAVRAYFESTLMIVATLRNRLSTSHGAGVGRRQVPRHLAKYALNVTASAILLIAEEAGES